MRSTNDISSLSGKIAIVTGGSSGIGAAVCTRLAAAGARVAIVASADPSKAQDVVARIEAVDGHARAFAADVRDARAVAALVAGVQKTLGDPDILVNAAGVYYQTPVDATSADQRDTMIDVNLKGAWNCAAAVAPVFKQRRSGKIVNIASVAAFLGIGGFSLYCATKAAVVMLTRALACELAPFGVSVNAVAPGNTETPMNEPFRKDPANADYLAAMQRVTPSGVTFSHPEEIAEGVLFLLARARPMHGSTLLMDEGVSAGLVL